MNEKIIWLTNDFEPTDEAHAAMGKVIDGDRVYFILPGSGSQELEKSEVNKMEKDNEVKDVIEAAMKTITEARAQKMAVGVPPARVEELNRIIYHARMIILEASELHMGPGDHPSGSSQDVHGNGDGESPEKSKEQSGGNQARGHTDSSAQEILDQLRNNPGGFSYRPLNGTSANKGFMTSVQDGPIFEPSVSDEEALKIINKFLDEKDSLLARKNFYVGGWLNGKDGKFYLDASANVSGFEDAMILAASTHQKAIFDLNTFNETFLKDWLEKNPGTFISQADRDWYKTHEY